MHDDYVSIYIHRLVINLFGFQYGSSMTFEKTPWINCLAIQSGKTKDEIDFLGNDWYLMFNSPKALVF